MPKRIKIIIGCWLLVVGCWLLVLNSKSAFAQTQSTCDLCGWCNRYAPTPAPSPANWDSCMNCLYEDGTGGQTAKPRAYYTVFGCLSTDPGEFAGKMLLVIFNVSGGIAFLAVLGGAAMVLTSGGDPIKLQTGKNIITSSIVGILLIVFSAFLLRIVGFDILKIPGFG